MLTSPAAGQLLLALCRRLIVPWHLLLLLLLGSTCGESIGKSLIGAPDIGQCLLPALLRLLGCHPLQQLLLVQHLRRQLALQMYIPFRQHTLSQPKLLYTETRISAQLQLAVHSAALQATRARSQSGMSSDSPGQVGRQ